MCPGIHYFKPTIMCPGIHYFKPVQKLNFHDD
jgi:hypothetical protein